MLSWSNINIIVRYCLRCERNFRTRYGKDSWVLVTGASDGLGKGFCEEFARRGFNIVLISRTKNKLEKLAAELESNFKVQTRVIAVDFTKSMQENIFENIDDQIKDLDISILVNNVGLGTYSPFDIVEKKELVNYISMNCMPIIFLSRNIIPRMLRR